MNRSGHASGLYASDEQVRVYLDRMGAYMAMRNALWLDRIQDKHTGEFPDWVRPELCNLWQADSYLANWAVDHGFLSPRSLKPDGLRHRQIGRLTAILYHRSAHHRRALTQELAAYLDRIEAPFLAKGEGQWAI